MIRYKKYQMTGEKSPLKGLWYARPVIEETFNIETLAKHMANHNTPYSAGVIKGVLADMISCIKELILDGKNVKLDDLAIFSVGIVSKERCNLSRRILPRRQRQGAETPGTRHRRVEQCSDQFGRSTERDFPI